MKDKNMGLSNVLVNFIEDLEESDLICVNERKKSESVMLVL